MKKILLILLLFFTITTTAQTKVLYTLTTNNIIIITTTYNHPKQQQIQIYDTTTTFEINLRTQQVQINTIRYSISEYAFNEPNQVYIILVEWSKGKFIYILYYKNEGIILIKYLDPNKVFWYYN